MQTIGEAIGVVAETVCDFSIDESAEAQTLLEFISAAAPLVGTLIDVEITQAQAYATFSTVATGAQTGTCVLLTDLQAALAYFNALSTAYKSQFTTKGGRVAAEVLIPAVPRLETRARM